MRPIQRMNWEHTLNSLHDQSRHRRLSEPQRRLLCAQWEGRFAHVPGVANSTYLPEMTFGGGYSQLGNSTPAQLD